jgi:hypothetical protein
MHSRSFYGDNEGHIPCLHYDQMHGNELMKILSIVLFLFVTLTVGNNDGQADQNAKINNVITELYKKIKGFTGEGIPTNNEINSLRALLSIDFIDVLRSARQKEIIYGKKSDAPVPPLIEGNIFTSSFEGYTSLGKIRQDNANAHRFTIEFTYLDSTKRHASEQKGESKPFVWTDRVIVKYEKNHWVIDDIELMGKSEFGLHGSLKKLLKEIEIQ